MDSTKSLTEQNYARFYNAVFSAIDKGEIENCNEAELTKHARALAVYHESHSGQDQMSAALLIHHLLLSKVLDRLQRSNNLIAIIVIFLSVMTLIEGGIQIYFSAEKTHSKQASTLPQASQHTPPTPAQLPTQ